MNSYSLKSYKKQLGSLIISSIVLFITCFVLGGFFYYNLVEDKKIDSSIYSTDYESTIEEDSDGDTYYSNTYYFTYGGEKYFCKNSSSIKADENIKIYFEMNRPYNCRTTAKDESSLYLGITFSIFFIFFVIILIALLKEINRCKKITYLKQNGRLITGLNYTLVNSNIYVNGVNYMQAIVDYTFPNGEMKTIKSLPLPIMSKYPETIDLLVDDNDYTNYYLGFDMAKDFYENK